jgi:3'-5' exoribonuclease
MARRNIADMVPGERTEDQVFRIASKDLRNTTQGSLYIHAILADASGQIVARMWQASESIYNSIPEDGFLRIKGRTESYKGNLQFIIEALRPVNPDQVDLSEFLPHTDQDIGEMWARTEQILGRITEPDLAALMQAFLADTELVERFKRAPAAAQLHHAFIGGLLEHTLNVLELALLVIPRYPRLSLDLVLAGVFLHDLGKTAELKYDTNFGYTDEGQLVGHIVQGAIWIDQKAQAVAEKTGKPFPTELKAILQHMVLSHHGSYEFGSPKLPAVPEAIALNHLDNLDAKVYMFLREIDNDPDPDSHWSNYCRALSSKIYKKDIMGTRGD